MKIRQVSIVAGLIFTLTACEDGKGFNPFKPKEGGEAAAPINSGSTRLVERDVEAPEVFQVSDQGLWDGRPSLGGVWVAHSSVSDPERVIIRNEANGKFVIGALFRRERENPGPSLQISSEAAAALGMLAGQPSKLNVTALRREEVAEQAETTEFDTPDGIEETSLDPIASAAAAINAPSATPPKPAAPAKPVAASGKQFIQLGIFSVKSNADATAVKLRGAGLVPLVKEQSSSGKTFWRVLVGPVTKRGDRATILKKVKGLGFSDAYFVTH